MKFGANSVPATESQAAISSGLSVSDSSQADSHSRLSQTHTAPTGTSFARTTEQSQGKRGLFSLFNCCSGRTSTIDAVVDSNDPQISRSRTGSAGSLMDKPISLLDQVVGETTTGAYAFHAEEQNTVIQPPTELATDTAAKMVNDESIDSSKSVDDISANLKTSKKDKMRDKETILAAVQQVEEYRCMKFHTYENDDGHNIERKKHPTSFNPKFHTVLSEEQFTVESMFPRGHQINASDVLLADLIRHSNGGEIPVRENFYHAHLANFPSIHIIEEFIDALYEYCIGKVPHDIDLAAIEHLVEKGLKNFEKVENDPKVAAIIRVPNPEYSDTGVNILSELFEDLTNQRTTSGCTTDWLVRDLSTVSGKEYDISEIEIIVTKRPPPGKLFDLNFKVKPTSELVGKE